MIRIGILGDIGSGKSYVAKCFGYQVFNADNEVSKIYKKDKKIFNKLKKILPTYFTEFPTRKDEVSNAILADEKNLNKNVNIIHKEVQKKLNIFLKKNKRKKIIILDIPLLLENKINKKKDILVFVKSKKIEILKRLKKRKNFNQKLFFKFRSIQLSLIYKIEKAQFVVKNDFKSITVRKCVNNIIKNVLK